MSLRSLRLLFYTGNAKPIPWSLLTPSRMIPSIKGNGRVKMVSAMCFLYNKSDKCVQTETSAKISCREPRVKLLQPHFKGETIMASGVEQISTE